jgi:hypothetical protein
MVCSKGTGAGGRSGSFTATTPIRRGLSYPYRYPNGCVIAVDGQLSGGESNSYL